MAGGNIPANQKAWFNAASRATGVPAPILAGIASVESNIGANASTSSTGAQGEMQFEPGTARQFGLNPYNTPQAILDAGKLLVKYGFHQNPERAIGAYNGGPGNPQMGYARQVLSEARRLGPQLGGGGGSSSSGGLPAIPGASGTSTMGVQVPTFDQAGYARANARYLAGSFVSQTDKSNPYEIKVKGEANFSDPLLSSGVLSTKPPNIASFQGTKTIQVAQQALQTLAGGTGLNVHPALRGGTVAGGFLPKGALYVQGRKDQGRDGRTNPGGPIIANGNGTVVAVKSDPNGFGPAYPVVTFTSGPYAGKTLYFGHTLAAVRPGQHVTAGQVISHTGTHGVGNATVPGWLEVGFAPGGSPGAFGQAAPF